MTFASKMKTLLLSLILAIAVGVVRASEDEGLFIPKWEVDPKHEIDDGEIVVRWKAERLKLTRAVFRYDTEDKKRFWLELDFTRWADPGDLYLFKIDGTDYHGFVVRGEGSNDGGGRWALGFTDAAAGRKLLAQTAKAYELPAKQTLDQTKGEQGGADQPATAPESKPEGKEEPKSEPEVRSQ